MLTVFLFEVPSLFWSRYRANSFSAFVAIAVAVLTYFFIRLMIRTPVTIAMIGGIFGIGAACQAGSLMWGFVDRTRRLSQQGLTDFVAFRSGLFPSTTHWIPQELFTALLLILPFSCASAAYLLRFERKGQTVFALMPILAVQAALVLSLSRALLWSTVLFFLTTCALMVGYRTITLKASSLLVAGAVGAVLLTLVCESVLYPGIFKAYEGHNISQTRSTQGRLGIWSRSLEVVRRHPFCGVDSSNAALFLLSTADHEETTGFASRAFSLPIQIVVEKGIVGFGLYSAFLILVGYEFHRTMRPGRPKDMRLPLSSNAKVRASPKRKREALQFQGEAAHKAMKCCFAAGLIAVLFRELTYSSLLEHTLTLVLLLALAAFACEDVSANQ